MYYMKLFESTQYASKQDVEIHVSKLQSVNLTVGENAVKK